MNEWFVKMLILSSIDVCFIEICNKTWSLIYICQRVEKKVWFLVVWWLHSVLLAQSMCCITKHVCCRVFV